MMRSQTAVEIAVGLFVTLALVGLVIGVVWGKNISLFSDRQYYTLIFDQVSGIEKGAPVVIRGIQCGEVKTIRLEEDGVKLVIWVQRDVSVYADFNVWIEMKDLMGGKQIVLDPGQSGVLANPSVHCRGDVQPDIVAILHQAEQTLGRLDSLIGQVALALETANIPDLTGEVRTLSHEASQLVRETRVPLKSSLASLDTTLNQLKEDTTIASLGALIHHADSAVQSLNRIVRQINSQQGTLGQLVYNQAFYTDAVRTTNRLDSLITDIQKNPRKYINVSVF